jgi:hypothetical protein
MRNGAQSGSVGHLPYDAFISYKRAPLDTAVAERLMTLLEGYRAPATLIKAHRGQVRPRIPRVFRDREELHASPDLQQSLEEALASSRFLIVVCSPGAARSPWVCCEIELFRRLRGLQFILPLLIDGEPSADLSDPRAAFPPPLVQQQSTQRADAAVVPLAADIRDGSEVVSQKKVLRTLRSEVLRLLAPMLGCAYDELVRRHHQRLVKRALAAASGLSAILLVVAATSTFGFLAERHTRKTTEDLLGKQSELLAVTEPGCDINRRWTFARSVEQQMESFQADSATQEAARQKVLSVAYGMQMMLAKEAGEAEYHDHAFEKARQQSVPLAIAQLRAFYPTFLSDLADLWVITKTRPAGWLTDQKALDLQFEHNAEIETWKGRLAVFDQLSDMAVTRKWAVEYTGLVAEFLQQNLLDLSIAEGRNEARRLLQRCREMWALAAHKQPLPEREQALVLEVQRALRRLGDS